MSDIVLDLKGVVDKYEGDAIISFFGAPLDMNDHARKACLASIRMKRTEAELKPAVPRGLPHPRTAPDPYRHQHRGHGRRQHGHEAEDGLHDDGQHVNLAARLEGVNKQYGTWILTSETTRAQAGDEISRGAWTAFASSEHPEAPVRLYEIIEAEARRPRPR